MTTHTFKVGDRVRIRQWDDMVNEFGLDQYGDIEIENNYFTKKMDHLCGREATINYIQENLLHLKDWSDASGDTEWKYCTEMLEPVNNQSKWTPEPAKYHNGNNWFTKETVCIDGKEMTVEEFQATTTLYRSALSAYNKYFPAK